LDEVFGTIGKGWMMRGRNEDKFWAKLHRELEEVKPVPLARKPRMKLLRINKIHSTKRAICLPAGTGLECGDLVAIYVIEPGLILLRKIKL